MNLLRVILKTLFNLLEGMKLEGERADSHEEDPLGHEVDVRAAVNRRVHLVLMTQPIKLFFSNLSHTKAI